MRTVDHGTSIPGEEGYVTERSKLLHEANGIVNKDRNSIYGNPEDNFLDIATLWSAYKGVPFSSMDVVVMNMLIKVARLKKTPGYRDGLVDIAGYAACGADIQANMLKKDNLQGETVQEILRREYETRTGAADRR